MIHAQESKVMVLIVPQSVTTSAAVTGTVSLLGWDYAEVILHLATQTAANTDTIALTESDGTTYTTATDLALTTVAPNTSAGQIYRWFIDCRVRKLNLKISYQPAGAARVASALLRLSRPEQAPITAAGRGDTAETIA